MRHVYKVLTLILLLFLPLFSVAESAKIDISEKKLKDIFSEYINQLDSIGVKKINGKSLTLIRRNSSKVKIKILDLVSISYQNDPAIRRSAVWLKSGNTILVSSKELSHLNELSLSFIMAHEFFRALNIYDEYYNVSYLTNALIHFDQLKKNNANFNYPNEFKNTLISLIESKNISFSFNFKSRVIATEGGGTSGVGGGGDLRGILYKSYILFELFLNYRSGKISLAKLKKSLIVLSNLKLEVSASVPKGHYVDAGKGLIILPEITQDNDASLNELLKSLSDAVLILSGEV